MKHSYLDKYAHLKSPIHHLDARAKIIGLFALIIACVTTPANSYLAFTGYGVILVVIWLASGLPLKHVLGRSLVILPFVILVTIFIPFLKTSAVGGSYNLGGLTVSQSGLLVLYNIVLKSYLAVISMILLSSTTPFDKLLKGLQQLKIPSLFITIAAFMYRYSFVIADEALRMKRARDSRNFSGKWIWDSKTIGHMIATLFIRSYERAERVYAAMVSRGYDGNVKTLDVQKISTRDILFIGLTATLLLMIRFWAAG